MTGLFGAAKEPAAIRYWQSRPFGALWPLLAAIVLLFAILPILADIVGRGRHPLWLLAANIAAASLFVVATFWAAIRRRFGALAAIVAIFIAVMLSLGAITDPRRAPLTGEPLDARLRLDTNAIAVAVAGSYALFVAFLFRESGVLARLRSEVDLAALIHARLVPPVDTLVDGWRCYGRSVASSEMGGDLLDVLPGPDHRPDQWTAYVADVSGHGVGAGLFMGVIKTALRMALRQHDDVGTAVAAANTAVHDQKRRDMFATLALVRGGPDGGVTICVAGHVPILHWSASTGTVAEVSQQQLPLGIRRTQGFALVQATCGPGDLLALLSDGITEVFDRRGAELGLSAVRTCLEQCGAGPLPEVYRHLAARARAHGPIRDDETILLLRRDT